MSERRAENVDHLRALEGDRLDVLQAALWEQAMAGDLGAITSVLKIIALRIRVFGLDQRSRGGNAGFPTALVVGTPEGNQGGNR